MAASKYLDRIDELESQIAELKAAMKPQQQRLSQLNQELHDVRAEWALAKKEPRVSDHAVIRYLERVHGFSFEKERDQLLTDEVKVAMKVGADRIKRDGYHLVLKDNVIVTVVD